MLNVPVVGMRLTESPLVGMGCLLLLLGVPDYLDIAGGTLLCLFFPMFDERLQLVDIV
jgi:hypothetical protein